MRTAAGRNYTARFVEKKVAVRHEPLAKRFALAFLLPFNLKGAGITLRYLGEGALAASGRRCNLLELTYGLRPKTSTCCT